MYTIWPVPSLPASSWPVASGSQKIAVASSLELRSMSGHTPSPHESRASVSPVSYRGERNMPRSKFSGVRSGPARWMPRARRSGPGASTACVFTAGGSP